MLSYVPYKYQNMDVSQSYTAGMAELNSDLALARYKTHLIVPSSDTEYLTWTRNSGVILTMKCYWGPIMCQVLGDTKTWPSKKIINTVYIHTHIYM